MNVLVTDAQQRTALHVIQYLGRKGVHVWACEKKGIPFYNIPGFLSRFCSKKFYTPDLEKNPKRYLKFLNSLTSRDIILIPIKITTILFVLRHQKEIKKNLHFCLPDLSSAALALQKSRLLKFALKLGINVPKTITPKSLGELDKLKNVLRFPVVIKVASESNIYQEKRYVIIKSKTKFVSEYLKMHNCVQKFPLVQEYIVGKNVGFHAIFDNERNLKGFFMHQRIRQYPLSGGPSTFCIGIFDKNLYTTGLKLLKALKWKGVAMVEFIRDKRGKYWLMEINPRFWGSFPLAVESNVDFPHLLYQISSKTSVDGISSYNPGVRFRFLFSDLKWLTAKIVNSNKKMRIFSIYVKDLFTQKTKEGNFSLDDPLPSIPYLAEFLSFLLKGGRAITQTIIK